MKPEVVKAHGNLTVTVKDLAGNVVSQQTIHNLFVDTGLGTIKDVLRGIYDGSPHVQFIAVGTGTTAAAAGDEALESEVYRQAITGMTEIDGTLNVQGYLGSSEANGSTLEEAGLFNADAVLLARALFSSGIEKTDTQTVSLSWDLTFTAV